MELINGMEKKEYFRNYMREYYKNNKERVRGWQDKYKENNLEDIKEYQKEYQKQYREEHLEELKEYSKEYYKSRSGAFIYMIQDHNLNIIRVGSCSNLNRLYRYKNDEIVPREEIWRILYMKVESEFNARDLAYICEEKLIYIHNPKYNLNGINEDYYRERTDLYERLEVMKKVKRWDWNILYLND